jgi:hypothetical protein
LDAILNRARGHQLHMLESVLWLRKAKAPPMRRPLALSVGRAAPEKSLERLDHPPRHS